MSTQNHISFAEYAAGCVVASQLHTEVVVEEKKRGRKSLWETDYDAAVKRQWGRVVKQLPKAPMKNLKKVPVKCEVVALLTQHGEVVERYGAVIGDANKVPKKRGRKSLWETNPEAAACREMEKWDELERKANKVVKPRAAKVVTEPKKRGRKSLWETDYDAAVKRQYKLVMGELCPKPKKSRSAAMQAAAKRRKLVVDKAAKELVMAKAEILELKAELDALRLPHTHSV